MPSIRNILDTAVDGHMLMSSVSGYILSIPKTLQYFAFSPHVREKFLAFYGCCGRDSVIVLNSIRTQSIGELQANPA